MLSAQDIKCVPFLSNYTATVDNLTVYTSFLQIYEQVGINTDPSNAFAAFVPTDRAWGRIEEILSAPDSI